MDGLSDGTISFHTSLRSAIITKHAAYRIDPRRYRRVRDNPPVPYRVQQIVLADHPIAVPYKKGKQVERLWLEVDQFCATTQFAACDIEPIITK